MKTRDIKTDSRTKKRQSKGQSVLEYAVVISIVTVACLAMGLYVNRTVAGQLKNITKLTTAERASSMTTRTFIGY